MENSLQIIWLVFQMLFGFLEPAADINTCYSTQKSGTATCSHAGYQTPGFPTRETWTRQDDTPNIFFGRAVHYSPGIMWSTALARGFDKEYLVQFDCLVSGFFVNDVGRVAWILYEDNAYMCLVVDNAKSRDLYGTVVINREAVEVEFNFNKEVLKANEIHGEDPIVVVAYQIDEPTVEEWWTAQRLDEWLVKHWVTSYEKEPRAWVQIKPSQQAWYMIDQEDKLWTQIPGCLNCLEEQAYGFTGKYTQYIVISGDSLDHISKKVYGYSHPRFWKAIYDANSSVMKNAYALEIGMVLRIPEWIELQAPNR